MVFLLSAAAQAYPSKSIKIIVPFPPGAATDMLARRLQINSGRRSVSPLLLKTSSGATGTIGSAFVATSPADGYMLLMATTSTHGIAPNLYKKAP